MMEGMEGEADALYLFGILSEAKTSAMSKSMPKGFREDDELRFQGLGEPGWTALVEPTEQLLWTGPAAEEKLQDVKWVGPRAIVHEQIVHWAYERFGSFYPSNLGTIFSDAKALQEGIEEQRDTLSAYFSTTEGCDQYSLKGYVDVARWRQNHSVDEASDGSDYLRRRARQGAKTLPMETLRGDAEALLRRLRAVVKEVDITQGKAKKDEDGRRRIFGWHLLVPRAAQSELRQVLETTAPELSSLLELDFLGPLPPYRFR